MNNTGILIYPPSQLMSTEVPKPDGSLGLLYLASALEKNGIQTNILDANIENNTLFRFEYQENRLIKVGMSFKEIAEYVKNGNYTFVVMTSNFTAQTRMVIETAKAIKNIYNVKIYIGGVNARALKEKFLQTKYFDGVCLTEGEITLPKVIIDGIEKIPGWAYLKDDKIIINPIDETCFIKNLDDIPMPSWEKLNIKYDVRDVTAISNNKSAAILTSRGCIFKCLYCHNSGEKSKMRFHSINRVLFEIKKLKSLGIKKVYIEDECLLAKKDRIIELFKLLEKEKMEFLGINGINLIHFFDSNWNVDIEYLKLLKSGGLYQMAFPVESGNQRILDKYCPNKIFLDKMDIISLMKVMKDVEIKAPVNLIIGFPDETEKEILNTIKLGVKLKNAGASYVSYFFATPYPGSKLFDIAIENGYLDRDFNTDDFNWKRPIMKNTTVNKYRLIELQKFANNISNDVEFINEMEAKTIRKLI